MNLFTKQKQTNRYKKIKLMVTKGESERGIDQDLVLTDTHYHI